jgi:menaquinone-specific isochorismate synthase
MTSLRDVSPSQFVFGIQPKDGTAFIGASPERLFRRIDNTVECEALAGTRPRGKTDDEDTALGEQLLGSEKDRREHGYVLDTVVNTVKELCSGQIIEDQVSLLKLPRVQHLMARFRGQLADDINDSDLLEALHPTPAVGGLPREKAIGHIGSLERFDRGWYAGPVGWMGAQSTEFAVGIRSGLIEDSSILLYSGAGIVKGSDAESEWQEIENKMAGFLNVITGK